MRRITLLLSMMCLVTGGAIGVVAGCGGDDDTPPTEAPDGAASSSSSGETGASSSSSSSGSIPDANTSSGSTPTSNPGRIACGGSHCDAGGGGNRNVCCARPNGGTETCTREDDCDNQGPDSGLTLECDEAADCDQDERCCFFQVEENGPGPGPDELVSQASCRNRCQAGNGGNLKRFPQLCKTAAECGDGGACTQKECGGFKVFVCGSPEGCK